MNLIFEPIICMINLSINLHYSITHSQVFAVSVFGLLFDSHNFAVYLQLFFIYKSFYFQKAFLSHWFSHESDIVGDCAPRDLCPAIRLEMFCDYKYSVISTWILTKNINSWLTFFSNTFCTDFQIIIIFICFANYLFL